MKRIIVLISNVGTGTNLQAIIDAQKSKNINAKIVCVISDTPDVYGLTRAKKNKIPTALCREKKDLLKIIKRYRPDLICLAGWKQIITNDLINHFKNKIINLHPGIIPDHLNTKVKNPDGTEALWNRGLLADKAISNFLSKKATYAGSSIHFLTENFDFGPVLGRVFIKIRKTDTVESLYNRLKNKEHEMYVKTLKNLTINQKANVLIVDGGGRGHAIAKKYLESPKVSKVFAIPGNDLMSQDGIKIYSNVKTTDTTEILKICKKEKIDLVDIAQDDAVAGGLTNLLNNNRINVFGPTKEASQIEWDKAWARNFMKQFNIPSPRFKICQSQREGQEFIKAQKNGSWYIKASGLASGKGALYAENNTQATEKIRQMKNFGKAAQVYLIEECVHGEEFSSFALVDGPNFIIVGHAQDHKTVYNSNLGPNTGGMGCSSPPMLINKSVENQIKIIFNKTAKGLVKLKRPYRGILYLGGMLDPKGKVKVIEFNARWGDPEAQIIIPAIKNDFYELASRIIEGKIKKIRIKKNNFYRIVIAGTSKGYPKDFHQVIGKQIYGIDEIRKIKNVEIFGGGIKKSNDKYLATGGRLFYVTAKGKNVAEARKIAYNALSLAYVEGNNLHYRTDIGYRDLERMHLR